MRWLAIGGVVLMLLGIFGVMDACVSDRSETSRGAIPTAPPPEEDGGTTLLAAVSGLMLAFGAGLVAVGLGRWSSPVPSKDRPANPWNEQPKDTGEPPVGLV